MCNAKFELVEQETDANPYQSRKNPRVNRFLFLERLNMLKPDLTINVFVANP